MNENNQNLKNVIVSKPMNCYKKEESLLNLLENPSKNIKIGENAIQITVPQREKSEVTGETLFKY